MSEQRPQLRSAEAETALIGAALLDYKVFLLDVSPGDFCWSSLAKLWEVGQLLAHKDIPVDEITLPSDVLQEVGGASGLLRFVERCPSVVRASHYAQIVKGLARQRRIVGIADRIARAAYKDTPERLSEFQKALDEGQQLLGSDGASIGWKTYTLADAYALRDPIKYLVPGMFSIPSLSIVYGSPGTLKSMLVGNLAVCVAGGKPWLPPRIEGESKVAGRPVMQSPAAWLDFDNGKRRMDERMEAMGRKQSLDTNVPLYYVSLPSPWLDATDTSLIKGFISYCKERELKMAVIDNLGSVSVNADENTGDMIRIMANLRRVAEEAEIALILIHHQRKATGFAGRVGENLRGHSSIEAALDLALWIEREESTPIIKVQSTKTRDVDIEPFGAYFAYEHKPGTTELAQATFFGIEADDSTSNAAVYRAVLTVVEENPGIRKEILVTQVKGGLPLVGVNRIRNAVDKLVEQGQLKEKSGDQHNAKHFFLP